MFHLTPWKKQNVSVKVRHDRPGAEDDQGLAPLARLHEDFESLMARFFNERWFEDRPLGSNLPSMGMSRGDWELDLGWEDKGQEYLFRTELPGFEPDEIDIKLSGNLLTVRAEHKEEKKDKQGGASYRYGAFTRTFTLPHGADEEKLDARYHHGVLEVHLPKTAAADSKRIEVHNA